MIGIYKITSPSGRVYIGQSRNVKNRFRNYKYGKYTKQRRLYESFKKYGFMEHTLEVIEECTVEMLNERERYWQDHYDVLGKKGLNCNLTPTDKKPYKVSEDTLLKMSLSLKGKYCGEKNKNYGRKHSQESINKMIEAQKRRTNKPNYNGDKNPFYGRSHSKKTKEMISKANSGENSYNYGKRGELSHNYGKKHTKETIDKKKRFGSNNWFYGKKHSQESKLKITNSKLGKQLRGSNPKAKKVININTMEVYDCIKDLSLILNINYDTLRHRIKIEKYGYKYL